MINEYLTQLNTFFSSAENLINEIIGAPQPVAPSIAVICGGLDLTSIGGSVSFIQSTSPVFATFLSGQTGSIDITGYAATLTDQNQNNIPIIYTLENPTMVSISLDGVTLNIGEQYTLTVYLNTEMKQMTIASTGEVITNITNQSNIPVNTILTYELPNGDTFYQPDGVTFTLWANPGSGFDTQITGQISYNETNTIMTFTPNNPLPYNTVIGTAPGSYYTFLGNTYPYYGYVWFTTEQEGGSI